MSAPTEFPGSDEVHVWHIDPERVTDSELRARYLALLSSEERARYERFLVDRPRHEYLVAHALVRLVLSRYASVQPKAWQFAAGPSGKPAIAGPPGHSWLRFNLSHTRGLCACAVARDLDVGVDVEVNDRPVSEALMASCLTAEERAQVAPWPEGQRSRIFLDFWTLKEAYLKARGVGLSIAPNALSFRLGPGESASVSFAAAVEDDPSLWQFVRLPPTITHCLAVAVRRPSRNLHVHLREYDLGSLRFDQPAD
jgi:4'-phosphopantetheinyl transferase